MNLKLILNNSENNLKFFILFPEYRGSSLFPHLRPLCSIQYKHQQTGEDQMKLATKTQNIFRSAQIATLTAALVAISCGMTVANATELKNLSSSSPSTGAAISLNSNQASKHTDNQSDAAPVKIDQIYTPNIGGIQQAIEIKTDDAKRPILLFLSGGPGSSMMPNAKAFTNALKDRFTIVQWDQRDAGKTLQLNPSPITPSASLMGKDTYEVIRFLQKELHQEKVYLLGSSWGNVLGFYIVRNHPELLHAYFAANPVVSQLESEKQLLEILKESLKENATASQELAQVNIPFKVDEDLFYLRKWLFFKEGKSFATSAEFKNGFMQWSKTWSPAWNEVMAIDLPKTLKTVNCPIYFMVGKNDIQTSTPITVNYFENVVAPKKGLFMFSNSGHQIHKDESAAFQQKIIEVLDTMQMKRD